ncbi:MAG: LytTR family transcriptional regulator [Saprospiraceae bacterium]|nr:LytTR family transcriptional regulator [Saprospiraceae bacterium]
MDKHWAAPALQAASWVMVSSKRSDALAAWQMGAAYFLLRPFTLSQLQTAIERAQICHSWKNGHAGRQAPSGNGLELVLIKGRKFQVQHSDILFLEARGEVTVVHLRGVGREKLTATRNLGFWETQLADADFIRVHKKFLVNLFHISSLIDCELQVQQYRIPVAKRRRKDVENVLFRHEMLQRRSAAE